MKQTSSSLGHLCATITVLIWGTTFISTKVLLRSLSPVEILFARFLIGFATLALLRPRRLKLRNWREELYFAAAGLMGVTFYYLLENIALTLTTASNVGVVSSSAPFFTGILAGWFLKAEKPGAQFYVGFAAAIAGIALISFNGNYNLQLNPLGDLLALLAAATWAVYSILIRKIGGWGYDTIQATKRMFFYGLLFMVPALFFMDFRIGIDRYLDPVNLGNILFLGLGASAACFVTWNMAVGLLGAVKTSVYIYVVPVITVAASVLILGEPLTPLLVVGAALALTGSWLSETRMFDKRKKTSPEA